MTRLSKADAQIQEILTVALNCASNKASQVSFDELINLCRERRHLTKSAEQYLEPKHKELYKG